MLETDTKGYSTWKSKLHSYQFLTATVISDLFLRIIGTTSCDSYKQEKHKYTRLLMSAPILQDCKSISFPVLICMRLKECPRHMWVSVLTQLSSVDSENMLLRHWTLDGSESRCSGISDVTPGLAAGRGAAAKTMVGVLPGSGFAVTRLVEGQKYMCKVSMLRRILNRRGGWHMACLYRQWKAQVTIISEVSSDHFSLD